MHKSVTLLAATDITDVGQSIGCSEMETGEVSDVVTLAEIAQTADELLLVALVISECVPHGADDHPDYSDDALVVARTLLCVKEVLRSGSQRSRDLVQRAIGLPTVS